MRVSGYTFFGIPIRDLPEVGHQDLVRDGSLRHRSGPAAHPAPSLPPPTMTARVIIVPLIALSPFLRDFFSRWGRRRRGGSSSCDRSLVLTTTRGGAGGEDATRGHIDDRIVLVGSDVHHVVVVVVVQVQVLVGRPLLHLPDGKQPHPRHHQPPSNHRPPIPPPLPVVRRLRQPTPPQNQWYLQAVPF